jgi:NitT/TauT family transport system substrate-binding protein
VLSVPTRNAIVARRDRGIAAPGDLAGKKIGVTPGTNGEYFLWAFMIRHRLAPESVTLVNVPPGDTARALASGAVDATSTWPPIVLEAQSALGANAVVFVQPDAYTETFAVIGRSEFLRTHPAATRAVVRALLKAERFSQAAPEEALHIVAKRLGVQAQELRPVLETLQPRVDLRQSHLITMEDEARWAMARGHAASGPVPNFLPHLHLDALLAVQPRRVTVLH